MRSRGWIGNGVLVLALLLAAGAVRACGVESDCRVGERLYRISLPEGATGPVGAVVWGHGYRGTAAGVMRNGSLRRMVHEAGLALIALEAKGGGWDIPNNPRDMASTGAAEFAYVEAVIADAEARFGIDRGQLVASGFSAGGMLAWNLACARPELFAGVVPVSGTFWQAPPEACVTPVVSLVHVHGDSDQTVPLDGRAIRQTRQGKVSEALEMYRVLGGFGAEIERRDGPLRCREARNAEGALLAFCLFEGGHSFRTEYLAHGLARLRETGALCAGEGCDGG